jgi:hypothetical protein
MNDEPCYASYGKAVVRLPLVCPVRFFRRRSPSRAPMCEGKPGRDGSGGAYGRVQCFDYDVDSTKPPGRWREAAPIPEAF